MNNETTKRAESARASAVVPILADPAVSYASYQNNVPLLRGLSVTKFQHQYLAELNEVGQIRRESNGRPRAAGRNVCDGKRRADEMIQQGLGQSL
jgi:hypothetical protein